MKSITTLLVALAVAASGMVYAQSNGMKDIDMKGMDMKNMDSKQCMEMMNKKDMKDMKDMKGMKGMDPEKCAEMMKDKGSKTSSKTAKAKTHEVIGVVKSIDAATGKVVLAHDPVKSLNWPAMTMAFGVKDKTVLEKFVVGSKVDVLFNKQENDYVITKVK